MKLRTKIFIALSAAGLIALLPISVAAATNTEIIAIMKEGMVQNLAGLSDYFKENGKLVKQAY